MIDRIFWVSCPQCSGMFYCDYSLRHGPAKLICPFCQNEFDADASPNIDDRWHAAPAGGAPAPEPRTRDGKA